MLFLIETSNLIHLTVLKSKSDGKRGSIFISEQNKVISLLMLIVLVNE